MPFPGLVSRVRAMDPWRLDLLIAAGLMVLFQIELLVLIPADTAHRGLIAVLLVVEAAAFSLRRRAPIVPMVLTLGLLAALDAFDPVYVDTLYTPFLVAFIGIYSVGRHASTRMALLAFAIGFALFCVDSGVDSENDTTLDVVLWASLLVGGPMLIGRLLRNRAELHRTLRERAAEAERGRSERAHRAVEDERERIAGELHDVVAHALGAMTVQAAAARRLVHHHPESARSAFAAVESSGREALTEIRRLLGVLRREDEELALAPQPSLRHVGSLASRVRAAGLAVELSVEGDVEALPAGVDLTAYRVVQEALGAALEESGAGSARVRVRRRGDDVLVEVADDGGAGGGSHLPALRDRVAVHGGQLLADEGRVRARLPIGSAA
ncbi:MAG TPA: histidine kinase [Solirubrobacteraceae bacterium]|jgi:signal transduction histidine kinase